MAEILYQWGIPSICRNGRGTELQYDRWKNQQSATEKGESRSTKEEEICPFAFVYTPLWGCKETGKANAEAVSGDGDGAES